MGWWSRLRASMRPAAKRGPIIKVVADGFDIVSPQDQSILARVRWPEVVKVETYKLDLITTDCICLLFERRDGAAPVEVSEELMGFAGLFGPLLSAFPSISEDWYAEVMKPAFERNQRVLYEASQSGHRAVV